MTCPTIAVALADLKGPQKLPILIVGGGDLTSLPPLRQQKERAQLLVCQMGLPLEGEQGRMWV